MIWFQFFSVALHSAAKKIEKKLFLSFWYKSSEKKKSIFSWTVRWIITHRTKKLRSSFWTSIDSFFFFFLPFVHFMKWQKQKHRVSCVVPTKSNYITLKEPTNENMKKKKPFAYTWETELLRTRTRHIYLVFFVTSVMNNIGSLHVCCVVDRVFFRW